MNIEGLGPETIDMFYRLNLIRNAADLYELKAEQISGLERMGEKSADNILKGVEQSKKVPYERVVYALGIRFVGETIAKKLARAFSGIQELAEATSEQLVNVDEIGERIAQSVKFYFSSPENRELIERLKAAGVQMERTAEEMEEASDLLQGKSIVISGLFKHYSRDEYKLMIEKHGGKNVGSISSKTSFILAGENMGPAKLEKAEKLGIQILNEEEFLKLISPE